MNYEMVFQFYFSLCRLTSKIIEQSLLCRRKQKRVWFSNWQEAALMQKGFGIRSNVWPGREYNAINRMKSVSETFKSGFEWKTFCSCVFNRSFRFRLNFTSLSLNPSKFKKLIFIRFLLSIRDIEVNTMCFDRIMFNSHTNCSAYKFGETECLTFQHNVYRQIDFDKIKMSSIGMHLL